MNATIVIAFTVSCRDDVAQPETSSEVPASSLEPVSPPPPTDASPGEGDALTRHVVDPVDLLPEIVVERMDVDFGAPPESDEPSLWEAFANQPYHERFSAITNEDWYATWHLYRGRILRLAEEGGLDAESLARCFERIEPPIDADIAIVPIGAFLARWDDEPVWVIVCNWEWSPMSSYHGPHTQEPLIAQMAHIRAWALSVRDCLLVDYMTCG